MAFALVPHRVLTPASSAGLGTVTGATRAGDAAEGAVAVMSRLPRVPWAGGGPGQPHPWAGGGGARTRGALRERLTLYRADGARIALLDGVRHPIRDVAFHPREPEVAIATGGHEGGLDEGELLVWRWGAGPPRSVLAGAPWVERVAYRDDGRRLAVLVRPVADDADDAAPPFCGAVLDDLGARPGPGPDPRLAGAARAPVYAFGLPLASRAARATAIADALARLGLAPRAPVCDLAWHPDGRLAAALGDGQLELWDAGAGTATALRVPGAAVQLLRHPDGLLVHATDPDGLLVHASDPDGDARHPGTSSIYELRDGELVRRNRLHSLHACSIDATGRVLARQGNRGRMRVDHVLERDGSLALEATLGEDLRGDLALRIDGAPVLYFVRALAPGMLRPRMLCSLDDALAVREELAWDGPRGRARDGVGLLLDGDLVRAYVWEREPLGGGRPPEVPDAAEPAAAGPAIERRAFETGAVVWWRALPAAALALAAWPAAGAVVAALVDGALLVLDAASGEVRLHEPLEIHGAPVVVSAIAVHGEALVLGTLDGQLALYGLR